MEPELKQYEMLEPLCDRGHVVLVRSRRDGRLYVKKTLKTGDPLLYRELMASPVPGMPRIGEVFSDGSGLILIEEYIPGRTLAEILREEGPLSRAETISVGLSLCGILQNLHGRSPSIVHRDLKPSNVIRQPDGTVTLLDLSAAKTETSGGRRDTQLLGTAGFAAPEQYGFSPSTPKTDLYGMGVLLNVLHTGCLPWERRAEGALGRIIKRCLMLDPKDRYRDAKELSSALKKAEEGQIPWLPPGFRSLCWYKMFPAFLWYCYILHFSLTHLVSDPDPVHQLSSRLLYFVAHLLPTLFYGNYLDMQRFFPLLRSKRRALRILGLILAPFFTLFLGVAVYLFVSVFCYATGNALFGRS